MTSPAAYNRITLALYMNAILLACVIIVLLTRDATPHLNLSSAAFGQTQLPIAGGAGLFVMPAQFSTNTWGCYVMDVDAQTLCAYQFVPHDTQLRFVAARSFRNDHRLSNYNTAPSPTEIKTWADKDATASSKGAADKTLPNKSVEAAPQDKPANNNQPETHTMAKMFYTLDETKASLGRNEEEIKQLTREGRLREFRDGPRLMFKADQVERLKNELGGSSDQISLNPTDSGAPIGLVDSRGQSGSGLGISLSDSESPLSGSGMQMQMKDDTALASDLGLSGSVGGMPSPGGQRAGGSVAGGSLTGMSNTATGRGGINVFGADDSVEHADPLAQTAISQHSDQVSLESVGSGSGLLDLTRESDDTSLGAELLDEIAPGTGKARRRPQAAPSDTGVGTGVSGLAAARGGAIAPPVYIEAPDPAGNAIGWMALGAALVSIVGALVLTCAVLGTRPTVVDQIAGMPTETRSIWILLGGGIIVSLILGAIGFLTARK